MALYLGSKKKNLFLNSLLHKPQFFIPRIPTEYQEVQYIKAAGGIGAYIDLGFTYDTAATIEIEFVESTASNTGRYIFGATENDGTVRCAITDTSGRGSMGYGTATGNSTGYIPLDLQNTEFLDNEFNFYRMTLKEGLAEFINVSTGISKISKGQINCSMTNNLYLFAQNYNGTMRYGAGFAQIKTFRYYDKNNILVCDFVPCYRKKDYEIGMYDLVSKTFFTNNGTGSFTRGPAVNKGLGSLDSKEYVEIEWISALPNVQAYLDLGFAFDTKARILISQYVANIDTVAYPFGACENEGALRCLLSSPINNEKATFYGSDGNSYIGSSVPVIENSENSFELIIEPSKLHIKNLTTGASPVTNTNQSLYTMTNNLYLLGQNYNGTPRFGGERRISYFKYYDKNDTLICDLTPCIKTQTGEIGMYDSVRKIFLTNAGVTGSFVAGPIKE